MHLEVASTHLHTEDVLYQFDAEYIQFHRCPPTPFYALRKNSNANACPFAKGYTESRKKTARDEIRKQTGPQVPQGPQGQIHQPSGLCASAAPGLAAVSA